MTKPKIAVLHYSGPGVVGGVEAVLDAHLHILAAHGYDVSMVAGRGDAAALPDGVYWIEVPEMDTSAPFLEAINPPLEHGEIPSEFEPARAQLAQRLAPILSSFDTWIVHNIFTKHFNIPLTAALIDLLKQGNPRNCIAWVHDITWTSPHSSSKVFPGFPWDLLRMPQPGVHYVAVSQERQKELAHLFGWEQAQIDVIYNGVDAHSTFGVTDESWQLIQRMGLMAADMVLIMPVRVTEAKNFELAARIVRALKDAHLHPRLVVTGPPDPHEMARMDYYQNLLALREQLGIGDEFCFVYDLPDEQGRPTQISQRQVADLIRVSDALLMPSHREGFGMPVLEGGLVGVPVFVSQRVPAAVEIGAGQVMLIDPDGDADEIAQKILNRILMDPVCQFKRKIRQNFTWEQIFRLQIEPILFAGEK
jgi:glycosyltransferase involved in cell wall biosynthesis